MPNQRIKVGIEYREPFDSIVALIENGCLPDEYAVVRDGGETVVVDRVTKNEYECVRGAADTDFETKAAQGFTRDGATWFEGMRTRGAENENAVWTSFIEKVAALYHREYAIFEYVQPPKPASELARDQLFADRVSAMLAEVFFDALKGRVLVEETTEDWEDIYCVSLKIELSGGIGAPVPVLCKVYFAKKGADGMEPLDYDSAREIDARIAEIEDGEDEATAYRDNLVARTLERLGRLIEGGDRAHRFSDVMLYSSPVDERTVADLFAMSSCDADCLECQSVRVLSVSHIKWRRSAFLLKIGEKPVFRLTVGFRNSIGLNCVNCGEGGALIENDAIAYADEDGDHSVRLDCESEHFGLSADEIDAIKQRSEIGRHMTTIRCPDNPRNPGCAQWACESQTLRVDCGGATRVLCGNCPYPELVYLDSAGRKKYTPRLVYAADTADLEEYAETEVCVCCGRRITKASYEQNGGLCRLCRNAAEGSESAKRTYRRYAGLLPLTKRAAVLFAKKYCYEDAELILFVLGKDLYKFDKLSIGERGYLPKPIKIRR